MLGRAASWHQDQLNKDALTVKPESRLEFKLLASFDAADEAGPRVSGMVGPRASAGQLQNQVSAGSHPGAGPVELRHLLQGSPAANLVPSVL